MYVCISEADLGGRSRGSGSPPPFHSKHMYETTGYPEINYKLFILCIIVTQYRIVLHI